MSNIYHITTRDLWSNCRDKSTYTNPSIDEVGFIHCSTKEQTVPTLNRRYAGAQNLILLEIDSNKVNSKIIYEDLKGTGSDHPHVYGNIPLSSVTKAWKLKHDVDGNFYFPNSDIIWIKTKSYGLATYSKGSEESNKLALVLPGRLDTKDYSDMQGHVDFLASRGYFALSFDPPGTWESSGKIEIYSMTNYNHAIQELIELINKPTLLVGHSRGGSMTMVAGPQNPKVLGIIAIMSGYSFTPDNDNKHDDNTWKTKGYKLHKRDLPNNRNDNRSFNLPYAFVEDQESYDMSQDLAVYPKPKLFIYGEKDSVVNPAIMKELYELSSDPKELKSIPSDHDYRFNKKLIEKANMIIGEFLDKYNLNN